MTTLDESYTRCRQLDRAYGTTYAVATVLLPRVKRHHVHALYGFCRYVDTLLDGLSNAPTAEREHALTHFGDRFFADLDHGDSDHEVLKAVVHTVRAFDVNPDCFQRYLHSRIMDLTITRYESFEDLLDYMDGSAAVIGEMILPILEPRDALAINHARDLGIAFQLTKFLRDVGVDLDRGHVYLPQEDLQRFNADPWLRKVTPEWQELMAFQIQRARDYYASADLGIPMLPPTSGRALQAARRIYSEILDRIERSRGEVFGTRTRVPAVRKALLMGRTVLTRRDS